MLNRDSEPKQLPARVERSGKQKQQKPLFVGMLMHTLVFCPPHVTFVSLKPTSTDFGMSHEAVAASPTRQSGRPSVDGERGAPTWEVFHMKVK